MASGLAGSVELAVTRIPTQRYRGYESVSPQKFSCGWCADRGGCVSPQSCEIPLPEPAKRNPILAFFRRLIGWNN